MGIYARIADFPGKENFPVYDPWDGALLSISSELAVTDSNKFPFFVIYGKVWRKSGNNQPRRVLGFRLTTLKDRML